MVRSIIGLTGIKNLISKSLGSTNKVNIAYAVIEGLRQQVPRNEWLGNQGKAPVADQPKAEATKAKVKATKAKAETTKAKATKTAKAAAPAKEEDK